METMEQTTKKVGEGEGSKPNTQQKLTDPAYFYWLDAVDYRGMVYLFGRTLMENNRHSQTCCAVFRGERQAYFHLRKKIRDTGQPITFNDFHNELVPLLASYKIKTFKMLFPKSTTNKCIGITYPVNNSSPQIPPNLKGTTFYKVVIDMNRSLTEIFLLEHNLKGPCWLQLMEPIEPKQKLSFCRYEYHCEYVVSASDKLDPPILTVCSISTIICSEITMLSCVTQTYDDLKGEITLECGQSFTIYQDTQTPEESQPGLFYSQNERHLLAIFINKFAHIGCDIVIGHNLRSDLIKILNERHDIPEICLLSQLRHSGQSDHKILKNHYFALHTALPQNSEESLFCGRAVCDVKVLAREVFKSESYDLDILCQSILGKENKTNLKEFTTLENARKLQEECLNILEISNKLNIIPLAMEITKTVGNLLRGTLKGGQSNKVKWLLLHSCYNAGYIIPNVPDRYEVRQRKSTTYQGALVLEPQIGFYDQLILVMDFNSLYPSIITEYNMCFTQSCLLPQILEELITLRRKAQELQQQADNSFMKAKYKMKDQILKSVANSVYGYLTFHNSRFYSLSLASLITQKGREILEHSKRLIEEMNFQVIYGDTDSLMIKTNTKDYAEVLIILKEIQEKINNNYVYISIGLECIFTKLILYQKKKYAGISIKKINGEFETEIIYKGVDVIRRNCPPLVAEVGKHIINLIFTKTEEDIFKGIQSYLKHVREKIENSEYSPSQFAVAMELHKNLETYNKHQPHVQAALRYNNKFGGTLGVGDTVYYVMCTDSQGENSFFHLKELQQDSNLKVNLSYFINHYMRPTIKKICEPIEQLQTVDFNGEEREEDSNNVPEIGPQDFDPFTFKCIACNTNIHYSIFSLEKFLKCGNNTCEVRPLDYLNQIELKLIESIRYYQEQYDKTDYYCCKCCNVVNKESYTQFKKCQFCHLELLPRFGEEKLFKQLYNFCSLFDLSQCSSSDSITPEVKEAYMRLFDVTLKAHPLFIEPHEMFSLLSI